MSNERPDPNDVIDSFDDFVDSLIGDEVEGGTKKTGYERERFTCESCGGTGLWRNGRQNYRGNNKCNACAGRGYFVTSKAERLKARAQRGLAKQRKVADVQRGNIEAAGADLFEWLMANQNWNSFAQSLITAHEEARNPWTEKQVAAAMRTMAKTEAARAERDANAPKVDLDPIRAMFDAAYDNGLKRPKYRAEGLVINRAPDHGANPGALYVKTTDGDYLGKVINGVYKGKSEALERLHSIAENPMEAAVRYGRQTGQCACCGRELTNKLSIELGIGPVCREKWGL